MPTEYQNAHEDEEVDGNVPVDFLSYEIAKSVLQKCTRVQFPQDQAPTSLQRPPRGQHCVPQGYIARTSTVGTRQGVNGGGSGGSAEVPPAPSSPDQMRLWRSNVDLVNCPIRRLDVGEGTNVSKVAGTGESAAGRAGVASANSDCTLRRREARLDCSKATMPSNSASLDERYQIDPKRLPPTATVCPMHLHTPHNFVDLRIGAHV